MERREFLGIGAAAAALLATSRVADAFGMPPALRLEETTAASLQAAMQQGSLTSRAITQGYLSRITTLDKKIKSVTELNPDALTIAAETDRDRRAGRIRWPLHGIPVLIKDNIDT